MTILLLNACPDADAGQSGDTHKFGGILEKAKKKALEQIKDKIQEQLDKTDDSDTSTAKGKQPSASGQPSSTSNPPNNTRHAVTPAATAQAASQETANNFAFCSLTLGTNRYYSPIFTLPATASHTVAPEVTNLMPEQFRQYVVETYQDKGVQRNGSCGHSWSTEAEAKRQKELDIEGFNGMALKFVETDYQWTNTPVKSRAEMLKVTQTSATALFTYCTISLHDPYRSFVSDIFPTWDTDHTTLFDANIPLFAQFISNTYGLEATKKTTWASAGCEIGKKTEAATQAQRSRDLAQLRSNARSEGVFETHWTNTSGTKAVPVKGPSSPE